MRLDFQELLRVGGVYQIRIGHLYYVGKTRSFALRLNQHALQLKRRVHANRELLSAFILNSGAIEFDVLEVFPDSTDDTTLNAAESFWIKYQRGTGKTVCNVNTYAVARKRIERERRDSLFKPEHTRKRNPRTVSSAGVIGVFTSGSSRKDAPLLNSFGLSLAFRARLARRLFIGGLCRIFANRGPGYLSA